MIVKQSGTTLTGSGGPDENQQWPIQNGKIAGNKITAQVTSPDGATYALTMTVDGDRISGDVIVTRATRLPRAKSSSSASHRALVKPRDFPFSGPLIIDS